MGTSKTYFLAVLLVLVTSTVSAQRSLIKGYLRDSITHYPIANGTITNWNTQKKVTTDNRGFFFIEATTNDQLYIEARAYNYDTVRYTPFFADTITLYLSPSGEILPGVTVRAAYNKYQLDSIRRKQDFDAMRGAELKTLGAPPKENFGVNINMDRFFKKKNQKKTEDLFRKTEERSYVEYRFSPQIVASYTGLKGDDLRLFMYRYTPSYNWLRRHPSEQDVLLYINDKLKIFKGR